MRRLHIAVGVVCLVVLFAVATAQAAPDSAMVHRSEDGKVVIRLFPRQACADEVQKFIPPHLREHFRAGDATFEGKPFTACFALPGDGSVVLVYSDGESGRVPAHIFTEEKSI